MVFPNWTLPPASLFARGPIIPVIVIHDLVQALPLARALQAGGINIMEITLRTEVALDAIRLLRKEIPEMLIGAGTVTTPTQYQQCLEAGAAFALSPGLTRDLLEEAKKYNMPLIPGVASASDLMEGTLLGYTHFKFFPAEASGGVNWLKAMHGPFPDCRFCPTGGIDEKNFLDYLALPHVNCIGGSWVVPTHALQQNDWAKITQLCRSSFALVPENMEY